MLPASFRTLRIERSEGVTTITLNRPEKRNCMNPTMHHEMHAALSELQYDDETRVLVITGAGPAFCAGQDLKEYFYDAKDPHDRAKTQAVANAWRGHLLRLFPKPTIAMINGYCFGGAFSIVAACDFAIAAEEATFGLSEINFKHFPGGLVTKVVSDMLRPRDALYYCMTGKTFDGRRAAEIGWVNQAVPLDRLREETWELAGLLKEKDPIALRITKETFKVGLLMGADFEAARYWSAAKSAEKSHLQQGSWLSEGIGDFLAGKYRPGLESHRDA